jgi:hypothetical protein
MNDDEMLTQALKALATEMEPLGAPDAVELKLREAFRKQNVVTPIVPKGTSSRYWVAAVIAAMLLIAVSVVAFRLNRQVDNQREVAKQEQPQSTPKDNNVSPVAPQEVAGVAGAPAPKPKHFRHVSARRPENMEVANHVQTEIATDFIPLSYMTAANLQDGGQIIRVELPRSALAKFGLPVNMDRYNEKVKADVLFGVDGMAHAIRFVQ